MRPSIQDILKKFNRWSSTSSQDCIHLTLLLLLATTLLAGLYRHWRSPHSGLFYSLQPSPDRTDHSWEYFRAEWNRGGVFGPLPLSKGVTAPPQIEPSSPDYFLNDPRERMPKEFTVPASLRNKVRFWFQIYAVYPSSIRVVHDRDNPGIIYGLIDFSAIESKISNRKERYRVKLEIEKKIKRQIREKFLSAINPGLEPVSSTVERERIRSFMSRNGMLDPTLLARRMQRIRTQTGQKNRFARAIQRSQSLMKHIESQFIKKNMPIELARIPFVESSFNVRAHSKDGAVGIWQFVPATARQMISVHDESLWRDPLVQTRAAVRLLALYRKLLPDWSLTITAYNSGVGRMQRLVKKYRAKNLAELLEKPQFEGLGFAGRNFYAEVLAANLVDRYQDEIFSQWEITPTSPLLVQYSIPFPKFNCAM